VFLAVGNAGPRHHFSLPETSRSHNVVWIDVLHAAPIGKIDQAAVVYPRGGAMMEFCRRGNDCFGKVKCANESKILMREKNEIATVA
jgi:hypothetical protein